MHLTENIVIKQIKQWARRDKYILSTSYPGINIRGVEHEAGHIAQLDLHQATRFAHSSLFSKLLKVHDLFKNTWSCDQASIVFFLRVIFYTLKNATYLLIWV